MENYYKNGTIGKFQKFVSKNKLELYKAYKQIFNLTNETAYICTTRFKQMLEKYDLYMFLSNPNNLNNYEISNKTLPPRKGNCLSYAVFGYNTSNLPYSQPYNCGDSLLKTYNMTTLKTSLIEHMAYFGIDITQICLENTKNQAPKDGSWNIGVYYRPFNYDKKQAADYHFVRQSVTNGKWYTRNGHKHRVKHFNYFPDFCDYTPIGVYNIKPNNRPNEEIIKFEKMIDQIMEETEK